MEALFSQIKLAANNGVYFLALAGALIIPDVCGALDSPNGQTDGSTYRKWFDQHAARRFYGKFDGEACYMFRCSLLHQGRTQHPRSSRYSRVLFIEPGASNVVAHMNVLNDALNIDVRLFCLEMVEAATDWQRAAEGLEPYATNIQSFMQRYPDGLPPYIGGVAVVS